MSCLVKFKLWWHFNFLLTFLLWWLFSFGAFMFWWIIRFFTFGNILVLGIFLLSTFYRLLSTVYCLLSTVYGLTLSWSCVGCLLYPGILPGDFGIPSPGLQLTKQHPKYSAPPYFWYSTVWLNEIWISAINDKCICRTALATLVC